jgi:hypothetical protein
LRSALFICCLFFLFPAFGQIHLAVKDRAGKKREVFYLSERLVFRLKNDATVYEGTITSIDAKKNEIQIGTASVNLQDIAVLYSQKERRDRYSGKLLSAGILYPLVDQFNHVVIRDNEFGLNRGVVIASGALIASGLAIKLLKRKKYRLKNRFRLVFVL